MKNAQDNSCDDLSYILHKIYLNALANTTGNTCKNEMEEHALKNVNNHLNTNIYSYLKTSGGQSYNLYLNVVQFFNASVNQTSVAAYDNWFHALVSQTCCSIVMASQPMFVERKVCYSALFTNLVGWHSGAVSFPLSCIILDRLACPLSDTMFCLHSE